jgi:hypothetical protein
LNIPYAGAPATLDAIRRTFEYAGFEFTNGDAPGLRLRKRTLHVGVLEDEIIITLPFTNYTVLGLLAKNFPTKDDSRVPMTRRSFSNGPGSSPTTRRVRSG